MRNHSVVNEHFGGCQICCTIERIQRIIISELTKIGIVHLYSQGYTDEDLVNFELGLTNPSKIYEEEKIELWNSKQSLGQSMVDSKLDQQNGCMITSSSSQKNRRKK